MYIKEFYSERIFKEFHRICNQGVIVKGSDFYYPPMSDNLYLWLHDILDVDMIRKYFKIISLHSYRYFYTTIPLLRVRIGRGLMRRGFKRALIIHTYYLVAYKKK